MKQTRAYFCRAAARIVAYSVGVIRPEASVRAAASSASSAGVVMSRAHVWGPPFATWLSGHRAAAGTSMRRTGSHEDTHQEIEPTEAHALALKPTNKRRGGGDREYNRMTKR
jgi:hypothetical protein